VNASRPEIWCLAEDREGSVWAGTGGGGLNRLRPGPLELLGAEAGLPPRNDTLAHLIDYAGQFALDYLRVAGIRCRLDLPDQPPAREISTDVRHNLFLVVKEALHNIVKHAHASEVWLRISRGAAQAASAEDPGFDADHVRRERPYF